MSEPNLSVVICTYNRQKFIGECLQCLKAQNLDNALWEIIVIDNNSTDNTASIAKEFIATNPQIQARYIFEQQQGLSFARNRGIKEAAGEIIIYIDDDVETVPDYLKTIYDFFKTHPAAAGMGGKTLPKYSECPEPAWISPYLAGITGTIDRGNEMRKFTPKMKYPSGCNMVYKKDVLLKAGGFNNELKARADDKYIFQQVKKINNEIWYVPQAFSLHNIDAKRLTFDSFKKLYLKGGNEERILTKSEGLSSMIKKTFELFAKTIAGVGLWLIYFLKRKGLKGKYIFLSQWFTFKGFLRKEVLVR